MNGRVPHWINVLGGPKSHIKKVLMLDHFGHHQIKETIYGCCDGIIERCKLVMFTTSRNLDACP